MVFRIFSDCVSLFFWGATVAEYGYKAMEKGELVAFNEGKLKFALEWIIPLLPRKMLLKASRKAMEKSR